jgi:hypothetical protein
MKLEYRAYRYGRDGQRVHSPAYATRKEAVAWLNDRVGGIERFINEQLGWCVDEDESDEE